MQGHRCAGIRIRGLDAGTIDSLKIPSLHTGLRYSLSGTVILLVGVSGGLLLST